MRAGVEQPCGPGVPTSLVFLFQVSSGPVVPTSVSFSFGGSPRSFQAVSSFRSVDSHAHMRCTRTQFSGLNTEDGDAN